MFDNKKSSLNPLASSFVPNKASDNDYLKEVAEKYIKDLMEKKEAKGEKTLTKIEMASLVGQLISLRFKAQNSSDFLRINRYLSDKILHNDDSLLKLQTKSIDIKAAPKPKFEPFDLYKFQPPKTSHLLVSFWGLYRHEQAQRPLLSLSFRPEVVKDKIWSLDSSDIKLWNSSCVKNCCACPPMFGYTVPSMFFGNPSHLIYTCPIQDVHLNHYQDSSQGNEFILTSSRNCNVLDEQPFVDFEVLEKKIDVDLLKEQFKAVITGLCEVLLKYEKVSDDVTEDITKDNKTSEKDIYQDYGTTFWDYDWTSEHPRNSSIQSLEDLADDNDHPLLEVENFEEDEGVSLEIEEMIRRSLSPKKESCAPITDIAFEDADVVDEKDVICDPPCSIWCSANDKENPKLLSVEVKANLDEKNPSEDAPVIDLLSAEQLNSQNVTANTVDLKQSLYENKGQRPSFRRSFSVNDCDPFYFDAKFSLNEAKRVFNTMSSKDVLMYLRKDPVNFFKAFDRSNSWKDNDSGIETHWSSQDDLFDRDQDEKGSMWTLFSGEDSLWKPLPECANESEEKPLAHKRVRDLRRQRSLN